MLKIDLKKLKVALKAHNARKEFPTFNDCYNEAYGLGDTAHRALIKRAASSKYGLLESNKKVTMKEVEQYLKTEV